MEQGLVAPVLIADGLPQFLPDGRWCNDEAAIMAPMSSLPAEDRPQPKSLTDLFVSFTLLALQGFGGVLAIVQRELVEKSAG